MNETLKVNEIFRSLQGEGVRAGMPCAFVRLAGCNLRCTWCDTKYAWDEGTEMTLDEITRAVEKLDLTRVELTGGEPLIQDA
jgi:7-carboxy-7-deazaguanine synthase